MYYMETAVWMKRKKQQQQHKRKKESNKNPKIYTPPYTWNLNFTGFLYNKVITHVKKCVYISNIYVKRESDCDSELNIRYDSLKISIKMMPFICVCCSVHPTEIYLFFSCLPLHTEIINPIWIDVVGVAVCLYFS